jgi:DNA uptake protein ComE-like DNA-binding protein
LKRPYPLVAACLLALLALPLGGLLAAPAAADPAPRTELADKSEKTELIDINSASKAALVKLPAVGDATADKIIAGRPWKSKYDLVVKKVVTRSTYDKFSKYIVARQPTTN